MVGGKIETKERKWKKRNDNEKVMGAVSHWSLVKRNIQDRMTGTFRKYPEDV